MNATELFHADGRTAGVYYCAQCRHVHREKQLAEECCKPHICECGAECAKHWCICDECRSKKDIARELARFEKAEKVTEWSGPVCEPQGDRYARNIDELLELLEEDATPEYVWTCSARPVCQLDYDKIIEHATEDAYEEFESDSLDGDVELMAALDAFNAANREHVCWETDYTKALVLPRSRT